MSLKTFVDGDPSTPTPTPGSVATAAWGNSIEDLRALFDNAVNAARSNGGALTDATLNAALTVVDAVVASLGGEVPPIPIFVSPGEWVVTSAVNFNAHNCFPVFAPQCVFNCSGDGMVTLPPTFIVLGTNPFASTPSFVSVTGGAPVLGLQDEIAARIAAITSTISGASSALATETARAEAAEGLLVKQDGSTPFTGNQSGITPTASQHLTRKDYVDAGDAAEASARTTAISTAVATETSRAEAAEGAIGSLGGSFSGNLLVASGTGSVGSISTIKIGYSIIGKVLTFQFALGCTITGSVFSLALPIPTSTGSQAFGVIQFPGASGNIALARMLGSDQLEICDIRTLPSASASDALPTGSIYISGTVTILCT